MKLKSVVFPFNKVLFELDSDHTTEQDVQITSSCLKMHSHLKTDCLLLCNKNFIIMHNHLITNHNMTDQFSCNGNLYVLTLLTQGKAYLQTSESDDDEPAYRLIDQGRLGISSCRNLAGTIRMEANENISYYSILIDKRFLHNLIKKNLILNQQSFVLSKLEQTNSFNYFTLPVCNEVLKAIEFLIQPNFSAPSYLHYLQLKFLEIFLLLENQLAQANQLSAEEQVSEPTLKAYDWILKNYKANFTIHSLSRNFGVNTARLHQEFKQLTGQTIRSFVINLKMEYSKSLLQENKYSIYEIAEMVGYKSVSHFVHRFKAQFGITPKKYIKNKKG